MQLNKVFIAGNLTRDPELRYTPGGLAVASFGLAVNRKYKDKGGEAKEDVCFVDINAFGRTAEVVGEYLTKGSPVFVEGRLQFSQWESKEGQKRSALRVVADNFQFLSSGNKGSGSGSDKAKTNKATDDYTPEGDNAAADIGDEEIPF